MVFKLGEFLGRLFGGGGGADAAPERGPALDYKGFTIAAEFRRQGSQWLTAGVISKGVGAETQEHHFIRAETHASRDDAADFALVKGRQIVDELGDRVFRQG